MKNLFRKVFELSGYTPVNLRALAHLRRQKPITRDDFFRLYFSTVDPKQFFFVQIGAGDGKLADPLYPYVSRYGLAGVALEPLPRAFARLQETYKEYPTVRCLNAALSEAGGEVTLYAPRSEDASLATLASLDRATLQKTLQAQHNGAGVGIVEHKVESFTFDQLCARERIERVDLLQIDCEGYDWRLLKTIDLGRWKPSLINFESALLTEEEKRESRAHLERHGYAWFEQGLDTCAYLV